MYFCLNFFQFSETFPPLKSSGSGGGRPKCIAISCVFSPFSAGNCCTGGGCCISGTSSGSRELSTSPVVVSCDMCCDC